MNLLKTRYHKRDFLRKERDSMSDKKEFSDIFDDDFEVTYEDDSGITLDITDASRTYERGKPREMTGSDFDTDYDDDYYEDDIDDYYDEDDSHKSTYDERRHRKKHTNGN